MSKVAIKGAATGTGVFTLESPATNTDRTLVLPDEAGTVLTTAGALSVNASAPAASATIDASGNLLVGKTSDSFGTAGASYRANGSISATATSNEVLDLNRLSTDGNIMRFFKDGTTVGSIGTYNGVSYYGGTNGGLMFNGADINPTNGTSTRTDGTNNIGASNYRFNDIYATNGTIQTSDRNEKQDIETLSEAEARVAVACKGLLRKFRWKDSVAEKGDEARIHFGIIAQDLQDAFAAEGLDAGRYAMFISSTWWEAERVVPAVEEVLDDEGNVVTEAVAEHTVVDSYQSAEEAPEGATERTRLGVRYPELLAFIIGAI